MCESITDVVPASCTEEAASSIRVGAAAEEMRDADVLSMDNISELVKGLMTIPRFVYQDLFPLDALHIHTPRDVLLKVILDILIY